MQNILKSFEEVFREMLEEKAVNRMRADANKCLITENRENLKFYKQREDVKAFDFKGTAAEFDALFESLNERLKAAESTMSEIIYLHGTKEGICFRVIMAQEMKGTVRHHHLIIYNENIESKRNGGIQPCLAD
ncbi:MULTISPECIES: hypothetical protein [Pseudobacteroides]|uniref:Uncharacterized protein n=1 Tax=Pseudobacteroides cellulosolvens ATCC 35603 = DSM 2933 TaxID=398512 RepID=A0A0L6JTK0_9FIRM|nr:hypothetical protein [Pseudobacteroides cellulosolvens]KNY29010.1 hypothetical protein Bccel_4284 [Pseudobacteroides cellulosolvens ATCC 35603 = DSM 2933]